jgi:outer membrane protein OmpA-like peptidoglycan-associated protein
MKTLLVLLAACSSPPAKPVAAKPAPPADLDHDGIADEADLCPSQPETVNELDDSDGCPDVFCQTFPVSVTCIMENMLFEHGSTTLEQQTIDKMVDALANHPNIARVTFVGSWSKKEPKRLGLVRAQAVVDALVKRGVASDRLRVASGKRNPDGGDVAYQLETTKLEKGGSLACTPFGAVEIAAREECK